MSKTIGSVAQIRPGLLDRLKAQSGIKSEEAFARLVGTTRQTIARLKNGEEPSLRVSVGIATAFGLGIGEVIEMIPQAEASNEAPLAKVA